MKVILFLAASIVGFLIFAMVYSTAKGYTAWYWRNPHIRIFVDGRRVSGYVHESRHGLIVTRGDLPKRHSYIVSFLDAGTVNLTDCSPWTASAFFVFVIQDVNPPCLANRTNSETPEGPWGPVRMHGNVLEFGTTDNKAIRIIR
jgi:hypothetical protein